MKKILIGKKLPVISLFFAVLSTVMLYSFRFVWSFVNIAVKWNGFMLCILCVFVLNTFALGVLTFIRLYKYESNGKELYRQKKYHTAVCVCSAISVFACIVAVVFSVITAKSQSAGVSFEYFKSALPLALFFTLPSLIAFSIPLMNEKKQKKAVCMLLSVTILLAGVTLFPITPYKITSAPAVIDNGTEYSIVFATTDNGTGYVTYSFSGKDYKVFDATGGRLNSDSKIHSIQVPYEHLKNNSYKIGSVRVLGSYSYGSRLGKEVVSESYKLSVNEGETQKYLTISDWHTNIKDAYKAAEFAGSYDGLILMGDASPGLDYEKEAIRNIVEFAGTLSGGTMPVIYTRGNHETRGNYAGKLLSALGLNEFYYTTKIGDISFIVLDSGEDKDDSHPEYGGMNDYNTYRTNQVEWLKNITVSTQRVVALSHSWQVSDVEKDLSDTAWAKLDSLGISIMVSGHSHNCRFIGENSDREKEIFTKYPLVTGYMDGGNTNEGFIASVLTFGKDNIHIEAFTDSGEKVFDKTVNWR